MVSGSVIAGPWSSLSAADPAFLCTMISRASRCTGARYVYVKSVFHINGSINFFTVPTVYDCDLVKLHVLELFFAQF